MNLLAALFLVANLGNAQVVEADTPGAAVRDLAKLVLGNAELLPGIPDSVFTGLPSPGEGIRFVARPLSSSPAADVFPVELTADRRGRILARRHFVFPFARGGLVVVARHLIEPGQVLQEADLSIISGRQERGLQKTFSRISDLTGQVAKTRIFAGRTITGRSVRQIHAVKRGDTVTVRFQDPSIRITMKGRAIQDGALGDLIRVLNTRSNRMIDGRVVGAGVVEIKSVSIGRM